MKFLYSTPGVHTNNFGMYEALTSNGNSLTVVSPKIKPFFSEMWPEISFVKIEQKKLKRIQSKRIKKFLNPVSHGSLRKIIDKADPDVCILRDTNAINAQLSRLSKKKGAVVINYYQRNSEQAQIKKALWDLATKLLISKYRYTTAIREANEELEDNTYFIPFPLWTKVLDNNIDQAFEKVVTHPIKILTVAKLDQKRKNIPFLINSLLPFLKNGKITLSLYGALRYRDSETYKKITELIDKHNLRNSVSVHANVDYFSMLDHYRDHDLFILPSYDEPAAISHFEAMGNGLPVIISSDNGSNYVIDENQNGFIFDYRDSNDLRLKVQYFTDNPHVIRDFGRKARNTIEQNCLPSHYLDRLLKIINLIKKEV